MSLWMCGGYYKYLNLLQFKKKWIGNKKYFKFNYIIILLFVAGKMSFHKIWNSVT
jgi:hypothetical protein